MSEDLSERAKRILGDLGDGSPIGDMTAALDEVDRLRAQIAALGGAHEAYVKAATVELRHAMATGRDDERVAVVAWLRVKCGAYFFADCIELGDHRAWFNAIERGEHRAGEVTR